jgi:two-component sensor histidine kinase
MLTQKLDVDSIFNAVFEVITKLADCTELFVARYDKEDSMIRYIFMRSVFSDGPLNASEIPAIPLAPEGYGILSEVIRSSKSVILNNYQEMLKKSKTKYNITVETEGVPEDSAGNKPESAVIIPIIFENEVLGAIQLYSVNKNAYSEQQLTFLEAFIQQASFAYHNAMLYRKAQDEIKERILAEEYLRSSLNERELLLKEIYHRVKNNLQVVSSLLKMQSDKIDDAEVKRFFLESRDRVSAISLIHEKLYRMRDLSKIDFTDYIFSLVENIKGLHTLQNSVKIDVAAQKLYLPIDIAMPCGLILNELITNALKHAFDDGCSEPRIQVTFTMTDEMKKFYMAVEDNGKGFPENVDIHNYDTLGLKLINTLIGQIDGTIELERVKGSKVAVEFPPSSYKERI